MLEIIKEIINYIPKESLNDMLNTKVASIISEQTDVEPISGWELGDLSRSYDEWKIP
jgi:hypothetical protein